MGAVEEGRAGLGGREMGGRAKYKGMYMVEGEAKEGEERWWWWGVGEKPVPTTKGAKELVK